MVIVAIDEEEVGTVNVSSSVHLADDERGMATFDRVGAEKASASRKVSDVDAVPVAERAVWLPRRTSTSTNADDACHCLEQETANASTKANDD